MPILSLRYDLRRAPFDATTSADLVATALEQCEWADRLGFATVTLSEHHGSPDGYLPSPLVFGAAVAARTRTLRLVIAALIAQELGRALAPIPFGPSTYLVTEALLEFGSEEQKRKFLPRLVSGELIGTYAQSERAGRSGVAAVTTTFAGGALSGVKFPVPDGAIAGLALVVAKGDAGPLLALAPLDAPGVEVTPVGSIDPSRPASRIAFDGARGEALANGAGEAAILHLLDRAAVLMAFEQIGGAERALEVTRDFTLHRYAFGRPVASFQTIKHRLADIYAAIQLATSNAYYGAWALSTGAPELAVAACGARIASSEAFDIAGKDIIQMHGGVGFTWEYDCHLFYRRAKLLSLSLGTPGEWRDRLIDRLEA